MTDTLEKKVHGRVGKQYTMETWMMVNGKKGASFYSDKPSSHITALATQHSRLVRTERVTVVPGVDSTEGTKKITKVTLR